MHRREGVLYGPILFVTDAQIFGERISDLRRERGLTQERLAGKADLTTGFVNAVEHGRQAPGFETILKLARALGVSPSELFRPFDRKR